MQVGIGVPHQVALITTQIAFYAKLRHAVIQAVVLVSLAIFTHIFIVQAGGERHRYAQLAPVRPAGVDTLVMTLKHDYAAGMRGVIPLRRHRYGLVLCGFTFTGIHHHAQIVVFAELTLIAQACLSLLDGFSRVVLFCTRRLLWISLPFCFG